MAGRTCREAASLAERPGFRLLNSKKSVPVEGPGRSVKSKRALLVLPRQHKPCEAGGVDVAEQRCARRQQRRVQESSVKVVATSGGAVHRCTALEDPRCLAVVKETDEGTPIVECATPGFDVAQEVVHPTVGTEVLTSACGLWEGNALASDDGSAIPRGTTVTEAHAIDVGRVVARERVYIIPIV